MTELEQEIRHALLKDINNWVSAPLFAEHPMFLHIVIVGDDEQMLLVAKQMALLAHFPSFDESNPDTCTRISILGRAETGEAWIDMFGNLLKRHDSWIDVPLDISIKHIPLVKDLVELSDSADKWIEKQRKIESNCLFVVYDVNSIDALRKSKCLALSDESREDMAMRANMVYETSQCFDIIRAEDLDNVNEYKKPVKMFLSQKKEDVLTKWRISDDLKASNYCLVDSILVRMRSLDLMTKSKHSCFLFKDSKYKILCENLLSMSMSEHARWNVEKLINGFRPFTKEEKSKHNSLSDEAKKRYELELKKNPKIHAHIDLCSYERLRLIDPNSVKYDSFLLLAMVKCWEKCF